jgi:hypothetical protein
VFKRKNNKYCNFDYHCGKKVEKIFMKGFFEKGKN